MTDDSQNRSFFKSMKLRKSKSNRKNSTDSSDQTTTKKSILQTRRVVKATPPPPSDGKIVPNPIEADPTDLDSSSDREFGFVAASVVSVQNEALREKTAQWRQDRLNASAAIRKEHKEKGILEHRLRSKEDGSGNAAAAVDGDHSPLEHDKENIPAALSVSSKFPEHKRKARSVDHDAGKKARSEEQEIDSDAAADADAEEKESVVTWQSKATKVVKAAAPGVIVAVAAIFAIRFLRKR